MQNETVDSEAADYIARIKGLSPEADTDLLNKLLISGYTQGCFLRPKPADLIPNTPDVSAAVLAALAEHGYEDAAPTEDDPYEYEPLPVSSISGTDPARSSSLRAATSSGA